MTWQPAAFAIACPFCGTSTTSSRCERCARNPRSPRRICGHCQRQTPTAERTCMHCGAAKPNDLSWKVMRLQQTIKPQRYARGVDLLTSVVAMLTKMI